MKKSNTSSHAMPHHLACVADRTYYYVFMFVCYLNEDNCDCVEARRGESWDPRTWLPQHPPTKEPLPNIPPGPKLLQSAGWALASFSTKLHDVITDPGPQGSDFFACHFIVVSFISVFALSLFLYPLFCCVLVSVMFSCCIAYCNNVNGSGMKEVGSGERSKIPKRK